MGWSWTVVQGFMTTTWEHDQSVSGRQEEVAYEHSKHKILENRWGAVQRARKSYCAANLSEDWIFQLEPGHRPKEDLLMPHLCVWGSHLRCPFFPAKILVVVHTQNLNVHVHSKWICQMRGWEFEEGGVSLWYANYNLLSSSVWILFRVLLFRTLYALQI